jgi:hypothetical protein
MGEKENIMSVPRSIREVVSRELGIVTSDIKFLVKSMSDGYAKNLTKQGVSQGSIFTDLPTAYAALNADANEALVVMPGSYTLTTEFAWAKDYTHFLGNVTPITLGQRVRFTSTTAALSPLITFAADGSVMKNVLWSQDGSNATTCAINMLMTGDRNHLKGVTLRNLGAAAVAGTATRNLKITSSNGENLYEECTIGADSVDYTSGTVVTIEYAGSATARDHYYRCNILSGGGAAGLFLLLGASSVTSFTKFEDCTFYNNDLGAGDPLTQGFSLNAGGNGSILLAGKTRVYGAAALETTDSGILLGENAVAAATSNTYVALTF